MRTIRRVAKVQTLRRALFPFGEITFGHFGTIFVRILT